MNLPARLLIGALALAAVAAPRALGQEPKEDPPATGRKPVPPKHPAGVHHPADCPVCALGEAAGPAPRAAPGADPPETPRARPAGIPEFRVECPVWDAVEADGLVEVFLVEGVAVYMGNFSIEARNIVLWIDPGAADAAGGLLGIYAGAARGAGKDGAKPKEEAPPPAPPPGEGFDRTIPGDLRRVLGPVLRAVYAEGNVVYRMGTRAVRTERLYTDFRRRILATGKVALSIPVRIASRGRSLPLVVRAETMRRTALDTLELRDVEYTTCDFEDPHFSFRATSFEITEEGDEQGFAAWSNVLRVEGVPVFWIPYLSGSSTLSARPLRNATLRKSSRFGTEALLLWGDDILLDRGRWGEWRVHTDWRSARGFGVGPEVQYDYGRYEGELITQYQRDRAHEDQFDDSPVPREDRGRVRWEHRHRFSPELRMDVSLFDFSDRNFQREYLKKEALEDRDPETYAYLRWRRGGDMATVAVQRRLDDFRTETMALPDAALRRVGAPIPASLAPRWLLDSATWSVDGRAGAYERQFDEATGLAGDGVTRQDAVARVEGTRWAGPVSLSPFATAGGTAWQGIDRSGGADGSEVRGDLAAGLRAEIEARRDFDGVASDLFDLRGLRHVAALEGLWFDRATVTEDPAGSRAVDRIDVLDEARVGSVRLRNRLQTMRGGRRVDWVDLEVRGLWFPDGLGPQTSPLGFKEEGLEEARHSDFVGEEKYRAAAPPGDAGPVEADLRVRLRENLYLIGGGEYALDPGRMATSAQGVRWFVAPKFAVYLGRRAIAGDSDIYTAVVDWAISDRWAFHVDQQTDFRNSEGLKTEVGLRRVWHDFVLELSYVDDRINNDTSFSFSLLPTALWDPPTSAENLGKLDYEAQRWYR